MEEKESTFSGSPGFNSETDSPPVSGGGDIRSVPEVTKMDANPSVDTNPLGFNTGGVVVVGGGSVVVDSVGKKKRGRPRKYDSEGNLRASYISPKSTATPTGFTLSSPPHPDFSSKRGGRGRPAGSGNWQILASFGDLFANSAGGDFTPHVVTVNTGEDVAAKILSFSQKGSRGVCVLSANGAVSNVTIRQPGSSGGILTYEGRFEILSLTGSFTMSENGGMRGRTGGLSVSLAGPDGRVIGGGIAGLLMAASPIQIVVGSFMPGGYKAHKRKHLPSPAAPPETVTAASPISQATPAGNVSLTLTPQLPVLSHGEANNNRTDRQNPNPNATFLESTDWNSSQPMHIQRPSPDINVSVSVE